eukprot:GHVU01215672.1.p1 GENE.GHVU01215672.1~~GHVU01215672.1.p1  ORF type:complete len:523 (+),score=51.19 GHVU01215672.1:239-1807(+)
MTREGPCTVIAFYVVLLASLAGGVGTAAAGGIHAFPAKWSLGTGCFGRSACDSKQVEPTTLRRQHGLPSAFLSGQGGVSSSGVPRWISPGTGPSDHGSADPVSFWQDRTGIVESTPLRALRRSAIGSPARAAPRYGRQLNTWVYATETNDATSIPSPVVQSKALDAHADVGASPGASPTSPMAQHHPRTSGEGVPSLSRVAWMLLRHHGRAALPLLCGAAATVAQVSLENGVAPADSAMVKELTTPKAFNDRAGTLLRNAIYYNCMQRVETAAADAVRSFSFSLAAERVKASLAAAHVRAVARGTSRQGEAGEEGASDGDTYAPTYDRGALSELVPVHAANLFRESVKSGVALAAVMRTNWMLGAASTFLFFAAQVLPSMLSSTLQPRSDDAEAAATGDALARLAALRRGSPTGGERDWASTAVVVDEHETKLRRAACQSRREAATKALAAACSRLQQLLPGPATFAVGAWMCQQGRIAAADAAKIFAISKGLSSLAQLQPHFGKIRSGLSNAGRQWASQQQ